jgi:glycosyltransferase
VSTEHLRIVTVAFNPGEELALWAESVLAATQRKADVVIVDNGAAGEVVDAVGRIYGASIVRPGRNLGYGTAVNRGAKAQGESMDSEWIVVVNPDVVFLPGSIDALIEAAAAWPKGGAFGPLVRDREGAVYPSARKFPRLVSGIGHALLVGVWPSNPFSRAYRENADTTRAHAVDWLSGSCLLLRRDAFEAVGGFDESYFMFFEDTTLGEQLAAAGWQSVFVPDAEVVHDQGASWRNKPENMIRAHHRSAVHYLDGVYDKPYQAPLRWALRAGLRAREELLVRLSRRQTSKKSLG